MAIEIFVGRGRSRPMETKIVEILGITKVKINIEPVASAKSADADQHSREQHGHSSN